MKFPTSPLLLVALSLGVASLQQEAKSQSVEVTTPMARWLSPVQQTRGQLFEHLKEKAGTEIVAPEYPANALYSWALTQYKERGKNEELYVVIYEQCLIAEELLKSADKLSSVDAVNQQKRRVIQLAQWGVIAAKTKLNDYVLASLIQETYQLPLLAAAPQVQWETNSRVSIVEDAASLYGQTKQTNKRIAAYKLLTQVAGTLNMADSARANLAYIYAEQKDYERAIAYLQAITDSSMKGAKTLIPEYQRLQNAQKTEQQ